MARGNLQITRRACPSCGLTKFERNAVEWGAGDLILLVATALFWVPVKLLWNALVNPWRCSTCGSKG